MITDKWKDKNILVVDDEDANFKFIEASLRKLYVNVIWAKNGREAVELCKTFPKIDLILMDIRMPIMNGFEATYQIRQINPQIPIVVQTAFTTLFESDNRMKANFDGFVTKPLNYDDLVNIISNHILP